MNFRVHRNVDGKYVIQERVRSKWVNLKHVFTDREDADNFLFLLDTLDRSSGEVIVQITRFLELKSDN